MLRPRTRNGNAFGVIALALIILVIGLLEIFRPFDLSVSVLTRGVVTLDTMIRIGIFTIIVVGLNLLMGYAGQISLGQAAFYGIGAYISGILTTLSLRHHFVIPGITDAWWWAWLAILIGMLVTGGFAFVIGRPILRLRGHYLAMATLGMGIVVFTLFRELSDLTGGVDGLRGVPHLAVGDFAIWPLDRYYFFTWAVALIVIILALNLVNSRIGRALRAIDGSELAANTLGVNTDRYKLQVFVLSAMFASVAGSLYAHFQTLVSPGPFDFISSVLFVVVAAVGGLASIWGAPFGVAVILFLQQFLRGEFETIFHLSGGGQEFAIFGLILILIMIFMPQGFTVRIVQAYHRWRARPASFSPPHAGEGDGGHAPRSHTITPLQ